MGTAKIRAAPAAAAAASPSKVSAALMSRVTLGQRGQHGRGPLRALPGPRVAQHGRHRGEQFVGLGGLDQVGVGALGQAVGAVGDLDGGGGHLDHRDGGRPRVRLDPPADLEAAHVRQVHVEQHQLGGRRPGRAPRRPVAASVTVCPPGAARWRGRSAWPRRRPRAAAAAVPAQVSVIARTRADPADGERQPLPGEVLLAQQRRGPGRRRHVTAGDDDRGHARRAAGRAACGRPCPACPGRRAPGRRGRPR